ncbi:MAG: geranylgeranyl pyrophosphate synthase [SAR116 cluster bacterium]|nr:geranylgeranyl pyrophosphate synthase [SAR116 cluster bacterium]
MKTINNDLVKLGKIIDKTLLSYLKKKKISQKRLSDSLLYSSLGSGKRLRAFMLIETAKAFGSLKPSNDTLIIATALELIHTYSLIHDDLPCMDNSSLRRGKKTSHIEFDEATAILLGDGLQSLAFEMISSHDLAIQNDVKLKIISELSRSIGFNGMVGGQMMDLVSEGRYNKLSPNEKYITQTQKLKTGALIIFSLKAGGIIGGANSKELKILEKFGEKIGLAFQIIDDILDCTSTEGLLGKSVDADLKSGKMTFVTLLGLEQSKLKVRKLIEEAKKEISKIPKDTEKLMMLAEFVEYRKN